MKNPPPPGLSVRHDRMEPLGISVSNGADVHGVTRQILTNLANGRWGIFPEMVILLDKAFGGTAEGWLALQRAYDLVQACKTEGSISVKSYKATNSVTPDKTG